jgi:hypothetical protein
MAPLSATGVRHHGMAFVSVDLDTVGCGHRLRNVLIVILTEALMADAPKIAYSLNLKGEGMSLTRDVDQATARAIVDLVLGGSASGLAPSQKGLDSVLKSPQTPASSNARLSLREFLDSAEAKRNPDKIVGIGEYIMAHDRQQAFTRDDVKGRFRNAGESPPGNYGRDFAWTISNGWIAEDPSNPGHFYVTQKGKAALAAKFSKEIKKKSTIKPTSRRKRRPLGKAQ